MTEKTSNIFKPLAKSLALKLTARMVRSAGGSNRLACRLAKALEDQTPALDSQFQREREKTADDGLSGKLQSAIFNAFLDDSHEQENQRPERPATNGKMSRAQAFEIFDLPENATAKEIEVAYSRLIRKNHPDAQGSTFIAKQLNEARETLLGKGRA